MWDEGPQLAARTEISVYLGLCQLPLGLPMECKTPTPPGEASDACSVRRSAGLELTTLPGAFSRGGAGVLGTYSRGDGTLSGG